jgi:hypothetical protein
MISLAAIVERLTGDVPLYGGIPTAAQVEQAIKDAVADLSARRSLRKRAEIVVDSGQASYELPADFLAPIRLESLLAAEGEALITPQGIIPVGASFQEEFTIAAGQITFYPTPTYSATRYLWYRAGYLLDEDEAYPEMTANDSRLALLKARASLLGLQADRAAQEAWQYAFGDEKVNKEKLAESLAKRAEALEKEYTQAVATGAGPVGLRPYR